MRYRVFRRTWWKKDRTGNYRPHIGRKYQVYGYSLRRTFSQEEARAICEKWNNENPPTVLGMKAEFESI